MEQLDLHEVERMFTDYRSMERQFWGSKFEQEKERFEAFKERFIPFNNELQDLKKTEAPFFNIFKALKIEESETKLHTPFLCYLLRPDSTHEQGALFLDSFFEHLNLPFRSSNISDLIIIDEFVLPYTHDSDNNVKGRIDIFIQFIYDGELKVIVVENKVKSGDVDKQIERYNEYLDKKLNLEPENYWIYYLTPDRRPPTESSISKSKLEKLRQKECFFELGYPFDIKPWLWNCYADESLKSEKIKDILLQYIKVIETL